MSYERFVDEYADVHIKDYDIEKREKQFDHAKTLHWNKFFRELVYQRKDLVKKYMMGDRFTKGTCKQLIEEMFKLAPGKENIAIPIKKKKRGCCTLDDIKTCKTPGDFKKVLSKYFSTHRSGLEYGISQLALEDLTFIEAVKPRVYIRILGNEGLLHVTPRAVSKAIKKENKDDLSDQAREIFETI